jgi:putative membrane protein
MHLNPDDGAKVAAAIRAAEAGTDGEISAIVATSSDTYNDVVLHWALLFGLLPLAISAAWPQLLVWGASLITPWDEPSLRFMLTLLLVKSIIAFLIARYVIGIQALRLALTPAATKHRRVRRRALMLFRTGTEQRTLSTTGVLLYLSLAERRAEIVADAAIHAKAPQEEWGEAMAALVAAMHDNRPGDGMAAAIERIGAVLAKHFPRTGTDPNELPDRLIQL